MQSVTCLARLSSATYAPQHRPLPPEPATDFCLFPAGIDMCNHAFGEAANCKISPMPGGVRLVARRALAAGEKCLIDYGSLSNDFLLLDYVRCAPICLMCLTGCCLICTTCSAACYTNSTLCAPMQAAGGVIGMLCFLAVARFNACFTLFARHLLHHFIMSYGSGFQSEYLVLGDPQSHVLYGGAGLCGHGQPARSRQNHVSKGAAGGAESPC